MRWSHSLGKFFPILYWFEHIFLFWGITSNNTSSPFSHKHVLILSSLSYHNFHMWSVLYMHTNYNSSGPNVTWFFFLCLPKELPVMHYRKLKVLLLVMYHGHKKRLGNDKSWKIRIFDLHLHLLLCSEFIACKFCRIGLSNRVTYV